MTDWQEIRGCGIEAQIRDDKSEIIRLGSLRWLKESGVDLASIGLFAAVATPYNLKFLWSPLVDGLPFPLLSRIFGQRRGWLLDDAAIDQIARAHGIDPARLQPASLSPDVSQQLQTVRKLATDLGVDGTPAFVIGDTVVSGEDLAGIKAAIAASRGGKG